MDKPEMKYVEVCADSGIFQFSRLIMGTDHLRHRDWVADGQLAMEKDEAYKVMDAAADGVINFYDTSQIYVGEAEQVFENWLKDRINQVSEGFPPVRMQLEKYTH